MGFLCCVPPSAALNQAARRGAARFGDRGHGYSAILKSAAKVMVVDRQPDRLALAEKIGAIAVDDSKGDPAEQVEELTGGEGADRGCECVGYQAHDHGGKEVPNLTMNNLVASVKPTGSIGVVGVFVPEDPGAPDEMAKEGKIAFDFGEFWFKGQRMATGQANVKNYKPQPSRTNHDRRGESILPGLARAASRRGSRRVQALR